VNVFFEDRIIIAEDSHVTAVYPQITKQCGLDAELCFSGQYLLLVSAQWVMTSCGHRDSNSDIPSPWLHPLGLTKGKGQVSMVTNTLVVLLTWSKTHPGRIY
jgi:hypothetical protein